MVQNKYVFDPYPLQVTMQRLAELAVSEKSCIFVPS